MREYEAFWETFWLAAVQGLTEYLPVSSSGHLVLLPYLRGWREQGLAFDVAVHVGSLIAVLVYFRAELLQIGRDCLARLGGARDTAASRLGWMLALASLMIAPAGVLLDDWIERTLRQPHVVAYATIAFGLLLGAADWVGKRTRPLTRLRWRDAVCIGLAQVLALIPGASRAGVTMTAGLLLGLERAAAARFSMLLAIPVILFAGLWQARKLLGQAAPVDWGLMVFAVGVAAGFALLCINYLLRFVQRVGMWPFMLYRLVLGGVLLYVLG